MVKRTKKESKIQNEILRYLDTFKGVLYHFKTIRCNKNGVPDIIVCYRGKFIAIECKTEKGKLSKLQGFARYFINGSGGDYILARSLDDVKEYFEKIKNEVIYDL